MLFAEAWVYFLNIVACNWQILLLAGHDVSACKKCNKHCTDKWKKVSKLLTEYCKLERPKLLSEECLRPNGKLRILFLYIQHRLNKKKQFDHVSITTKWYLWSSEDIYTSYLLWELFPDLFSSKCIAKLAAFDMITAGIFMHLFLDMQRWLRKVRW